MAGNPTRASRTGSRRPTAGSTTRWRRATLDAEPGRPFPLGATLAGDGVNFAVLSPRALCVEVDLFDTPDAARASRRVVLAARTGDVVHGHVARLAAGQLYGLRVHGPHVPAQGLWFDPSRLLVDPFARAVAGGLQLGPGLLTREPPGAGDTAGLVPKGVVVDETFDWEGDVRPSTPLARTVFYECHVQGMTARHPLVPERLRGTYLGLAEPAVIRHLLRIGVTAVELLPVQQHARELHLLRAGRPNYWGYSPLALLAPHGAYATSDLGAQVSEMKALVRALHRAGIEVILDTCLGHTCEGGRSGTTVSLKGVDNPAYYRLEDHDASLWADDTGCGNMLDARAPGARQLVLGSLRHWAREYHVDGFRFDQAVVLARDEGSGQPALLDAITSDPELTSLKLVAEPWDLGPDGYRLGRFGRRFSEWNDKYREDVRHFWSGARAAAPGLARRLAGSPDVFGASGRGPLAGVNFVACHDGFTLHDLVTYHCKRNEANGEQNRDGRSEERGYGFGVEGETQDGRILRRRRRAARSLMGTLALSQGLPLFGHGDELGRTQAGNNNAYCHASDLTFIDWNEDPERAALTEFVAAAFALRRRQPALRRETFAGDEPHGAGGPLDAQWLTPDGHALQGAAWEAPDLRALALLLTGYPAGQQEPPLLALFNASDRRCRFSLPPGSEDAGRWREVLHAGRSRLRLLASLATVVPSSGLVVLEWTQATA